MGRLIKLLFLLILLSVVGIGGYALFGDLSAPSEAVTIPVVIDVD
jgi:hypothetical protein